ncbi:dephospho-CoA kinase [Spiroplasma clarkii]|uniref:Dephospho-CoA kinase n=1 Tax=Spiroplasma clarkii TaxID=2139 RepID=A0A2K8KH24_9MOLU|nr:dephospho-CoA kinase [Spiroplasma clarkii]ATX70968.1 dephospho-CoA kinase [Spiroplasma clarkii]
MFVIGVSGFIGAGKSTLLNYLKKTYEVVVIEADLISKEVIKDARVLEFLKVNIPQVITNEGKIDRKKLRSIVFLDAKLNDKFTEIMWPLISDKINYLISHDYKNERVVVIEAAIIAGLNVKFDITILLQKDELQRIDDVVARDEREVQEIKSVSSYQRNNLNNFKFDYVLENNDNIEVFYENIDKLVKQISSTHHNK